MINSILKMIQIISFVLFFTGGLYLLIGNISIKSKQLRKSRAIIGLVGILTSSLIMLLTSIFIVNNNALYTNVNFPVFHQLWIIIKAVLMCYLDILIFIVLVSGLYFIVLLFIKVHKTYNMYAMNLDVINLRFTLIEKIMYFNLFYETKIQCLKNKDTIFISKYAYNELQLYNAKHKKENM